MSSSGTQDAPSSKITKYSLHIEQNGAIVGECEKKFSTKCGKLIRTHIPIGYDDWRNVYKAEEHPGEFVTQSEAWKRAHRNKATGIVHPCALKKYQQGSKLRSALRSDVGTISSNIPQVLEGRSYRLQHPRVGIVNRSQADNVDMIVARRREREYFANSLEYSHLSSKMGSEYLAKLLSRAQLYTILELCWGL